MGTIAARWRGQAARGVLAAIAALLSMPAMADVASTRPPGRRVPKAYR